MIKDLVIISTSHNQEVIDKNLGESLFCNENDILFVPDYGNVAKSYNSAHTQYQISHKKMLMFVHEDVYFPDGFEEQLKQAIVDLNWSGANWGVLGVAGVNMLGENGRSYHGNINDRGREWGHQISKPEKVQTLDELLLIVNPSLRFDEQFDLDFYGLDICMQAHEKGLGVYVIPGYVHHNSSRVVGGRTPSFYANQERFVRKWRHKLPVATTCAMLHKEMYP